MPCQQKNSSPSPCLLCFGLMILRLDPNHSLGSKQELRLSLGMFSTSTGLAPAEAVDEPHHLDEVGASPVMLPSSTTEVKHSQEESREIPLEFSDPPGFPGT